MPRTSEFGKGFIYNLVLFTKHYERAAQYQQAYKANGIGMVNGPNSLWFNRAGDYFYEFEVPKGWERRKVGQLALKLKNQVLHFKLNRCSDKEFEKFWEDIHKLCQLIDKQLGIKVIPTSFN